MAVFLAVIAQYPPCFYTNDDYRMMTIAAGAYTGTPSADMVFMMYPVGMLLAGLYSVTTKIPWYGVFTMLCMFIPSCIFCHYIVKKAYLKKCTVLGVILYLFLFVFVIRKYICLPQFTLTSAFMGTGAVALFHEMPEKKEQKTHRTCSVMFRCSICRTSKSILSIASINWAHHDCTDNQ